MVVGVEVALGAVPDNGLDATAPACGAAEPCVSMVLRLRLLYLFADSDSLVLAPGTTSTLS